MTQLCIECEDNLDPKRNRLRLGVLIGGAQFVSIFSPIHGGKHVNVVQVQTIMCHH